MRKSLLTADIFGVDSNRPCACSHRRQTVVSPVCRKTSAQVIYALASVATILKPAILKHGLGLAALMLIGLSAGCRTSSTPPGQAPAAVRMIPGIGQWAEKEALRRAAESDPFPTAAEAGL